jgi:hypothetical protein
VPIEATMKLRPILIALAALVTPAIAHAAVPPDLNQPESLCPGISLPGLEFGKDEGAQSKAILEALRQEWPIGSGEAEYTQWSGRLFAVEWRMPTDDAAASQVWSNGIEDWLDENGWVPVELPELRSLRSMGSSMAQKTVNGRDLVIEFDTDGIQLLRCADRELLELARNELEGDLAPGSLRPLAPLAPTQPWRLPGREECTRPELIAAFSQIKQSTELGPMLERHFPAEDPALAESDYQRRLNIWLNWKLRGEGGLSEEQVWEFDRPAEKADAGIDQTVALLETLGRWAEVEKTKDGKSMCEAGIAILDAMHKTSLSEAAEHRASNALLEAEARRLGIAVD